MLAVDAEPARRVSVPYREPTEIAAPTQLIGTVSSYGHALRQRAPSAHVETTRSYSDTGLRHDTASRQLDTARTARDTSKGKTTTPMTIPSLIPRTRV